MYMPRDGQEDDLRCYLKDLYALGEAFLCTHCIVDPNNLKALLKRFGPRRYSVTKKGRLTSRCRSSPAHASRQPKILPSMNDAQYDLIYQSALVESMYDHRLCVVKMTDSE